MRKLPLLISAEIFVAFESELVSVAFSHNFQIPKNFDLSAAQSDIRGSMPRAHMALRVAGS